MYPRRLYTSSSVWIAIFVLITKTCMVRAGDLEKDACLDKEILGGFGRITICNSDISLEFKTVQGQVRRVNIVADMLKENSPVFKSDRDRFTAKWSNDLKLLIQPEVTKSGKAYRLLWTAAPTDMDTLTLTIDLAQANWYGGGETFTQAWPIQTQDIPEVPFVPNAQNGGVLARYFLSSEGLAHLVDATTPLFVSLNSSAESLTFRAAFETPYRNTDGRQLTLGHVVVIGEDMLDAHMISLNNYLGFPTSIPSEDVFRNPIWSTWVSYKKGISQSKVLQFADAILEHGYPASQIEIDDNWETCYGDELFDPRKFPDPLNMTTQLHQQGHNVTIWVHPFVDVKCTTTFQEGNDLKYFVFTGDNETTGLGSWWDGDLAGVIDVTRSDAADWWKGRLDNLRATTGIDSFKFDAGEIQFLPEDSYLNCTEDLQPGCYSTAYVHFAAQSGGRIESRDGYYSQTTGIFVRMLDRESSWGLDNGLHSVITSSLHMGLLGYPFVLPDMVGGNAYSEIPFDELFVRWAALNAFLPAMQFSIVPWSYNDGVSNICLQMVQLHQELGDAIMAAANEAIISGAPIIRPLWWLNSSDVTAQVINDEFLVGDAYLVAPIVKEGTFARDIYLPKGNWKEYMNEQSVFEGPVWLTNYAVDIDQIAYFFHLDD